MVLIWPARVRIAPHLRIESEIEAQIMRDAQLSQIADQNKARCHCIAGKDFPAFTGRPDRRQSFLARL
jgi:hypothetical protein